MTTPSPPRPQLLIATVDGAFFGRGEASPFEDCLVINQTGESVRANAADSASTSTADSPLASTVNSQSTATASPRVRVFDYAESGLSRSRNRALSNAGADIAVIADDDVRHPPAAPARVAAAFAAHPQADIITFQAQTPAGAPFKRYPAHARRHTVRSVMRVSSWEIALRLESIRAAGLRFDERFGLGAEFPTGEENIFLVDALRRGLAVRYQPQVIAIHPAASSGADLSTAAAVRAKGAAFRRMFGAAFLPVALAFAVKKYRLSAFSCREFYRHMRDGGARFDRADRGDGDNYNNLTGA